jgi:two-component system CheB/CheR fusion protein
VRDAHEEPVQPSELQPRLQRALVVDDAVDAASSLARFLRVHGMEVDVAHDGHAALEAVARFNPEIVFLDLELPKLDGLEVARRLRRRLGGERITLVATTGHGRPEDLRRSAEAGFDHHLTKPLDPDEIRALLHSPGVSANPDRRPP